MGNIVRRVPKESTGESGGFPTTDRAKVVAEKRAFEQTVNKEVERRMHALGLGGQTHDTCGEAHAQSTRDTGSGLPTSIGRPGAPWRNSPNAGRVSMRRNPGGIGDNSTKERGRGGESYKTTEFRK